ncbi:hypothetical protein EKN56_11945 [Limnobaculum zhutongyuii]|uniref:Aminopeptidase n=1 Tax=Limnobaculum zhutongyuii TaxID=2498113 RepID=A0A411WLM0_9GAMM|nr:hypothetical protein [Limnobaculum zhutongyuii]QBH97046.1 hypothetical protein EKN56_11945 [Limnobaculum zhutongyuii]TQS87404.1 hypothetical protein ELQ32_13865 [Limnobaculum zhutongyuii]
MRSHKYFASGRFLPLLLLLSVALSGCSSSPDFKSRAAGLTAKNGLTEQEVLDIDPFVEITEHDIQQAVREASKSSFLIPSRAQIVLVQSGATVPDAVMQQEMMNYFSVSVYSGLSPSKQRSPVARKNEEQEEAPQPNYIRSLRLASAKARQDKIIVYWGTLELGMPDKDNIQVVWLPYHNGEIPKETKLLRYSIRFASVDVRNGMWVMYTPPNTESEFMSVPFQSDQTKLNQIIKIKEESYIEAAKNFATHFEKIRR